MSISQKSCLDYLYIDDTFYNDDCINKKNLLHFTKKSYIIPERRDYYSRNQSVLNAS